MDTFRQGMAALLVISLVGFVQGSTFDQIRYNGGTLQTQVDPKDWDNVLTIEPGYIRLRLKDGQSLTIDPARVTQLSYGQEAHRRVGTMIALGILLAPLILFGLFHKTRLHFIGIEYTDDQGRNAGVLIQAHKDNYRGVLMALRGATRAPIAVAEEDRKYVASAVGEGAIGVAAAPPAAVPTTPAAAPAAPAAPAPSVAAPSPATPPPAAADDKGLIALATTPAGASIFVDEKFVGMTPAKLRLKPGAHKIRLFLFGYKEWIQEIEVMAGSEVNLSLELQK
ncbi:MAG: PEGA domain-containing protein [Kiritimatiellae bacterium]|nr:PEGA domain-containing protein [Kiritimatiellia bacterium]HNU01887.1 PEGA domain-containing protein [Acidobacteriota bacterium]